MGLDAVEFLMDVEKTFQVRFEDSEVEQFKTFGDLRSAIVRKLTRPGRGGCLSSVLFYRMRRALVTLFGVPRAQVVPDAQLEELLPQQGKRRSWAAFRRELGDIRAPELTRPRFITVLLLVLFLGLILTGIVIGIVNSPLLPPGWLFILGGIAWPILGYFISKPLAIFVPSSCSTVRSGAMTLLSMNHGRLAQEVAYVNEAEIWQTVRMLLVEHTGVAQENITPEKNFRDLGL
jgi:acyl carrier protein